MQTLLRRRHGRWSQALALVSLLWAGTTLAKMDDSTVNVRISGTVVANGSCTFTGTDPVTVDFGDVIINDIQGQTYKKNVPYSLSCRGDPGGKAIQMKLTGTVADFDGTLLETDAKGLGLSLQKDDKAMPLNQWVDINPASPPTFAAVLVKAKDAGFYNGQAFKGSATLIVGFN